MYLEFKNLKKFNLIKFQLVKKTKNRKWAKMGRKLFIPLLPTPTLPTCVNSELFYPLDLKSPVIFGVIDS